MKAILSNRIYLDVTPEQQREIDKELTYSIASYDSSAPPTVIKNMGIIREGLITIPIGRMDLIPQGHEIIDKRILAPTTFPEFRFDLRASQAAVYDDLDDNAIINAFVSWGKTFTALAIAGKLGQKTLIITHTVPLRNQWIKEIKKVFGFEPGIIGSGKFDIDSPIVVGNTQTLYKKTAEIAREFGTVILDECLDYDSRITTSEGPKSIGTIVNNKIFCDVLSFNENTKEFEWKPIVSHFKNKETEEMIKFTFDNKSVLKCTLNHNIYSLNKGKILAGSLLEGDYVVCDKSHKSSNLLTEEAKPIVLAMIMGDGSLPSNSHSCRLHITQGETQVEYFNYKLNILRGGFKQDAVISQSGYKKENNIIASSSLSFYDIDNWRAKLYNNSTSKNNITKELSNLLTKESWSIMYQDDGSISKNKYVTFSFCELNNESLLILRDSLISIFNLADPKIYSNAGFNYIRLSRHDSELFVEQIAHLIHPSLQYKKGIYGQNTEFIGIKPLNMFENYTAQKVISIDFEKPTGGFRYNIEVADNHNYLAGHKLVSNCHHVSSPTFAKILDKSCARYKIGLSGTILRKDGKHVVFRDYFGNKVYKPPKENYIVPEIHIYHTNIRFMDGARTPWALRVNDLVNQDIYKHTIAIIASKYAAMKHNVLVLSDRTHFLQTVANLIGEKAVCIIGPTKNREELLASIGVTANTVCGTQAIFSEGISHNPLSCLVLGTPVNNEPLLEQLIGRVIRELEGKETPIIVDINLKGDTARRQAQSRLGYYIKQGYKITNYYV